MKKMLKKSFVNLNHHASVFSHPLFNPTNLKQKKKLCEGFKTGKKAHQQEKASALYVV